MNHNEHHYYGIFIGLGYLILILALSVSLWKCKVLTDELSYTQSTIEKISEIYRIKEGHAYVEGIDVNYHIITIDGGVTWYAINKDRLVIGLAQNVYPGLLEQGICTSKPTYLGKVVDMTRPKTDVLSRLMGVGLKIQYSEEK